MSVTFSKCLVLAGTCFTGSHFVNHLLENTQCSVAVTSRSGDTNPCFLPYLYQKKRSDRLSTHPIDVNEDMEKLFAICDEFQPDVVVNYAAQAEVRNSWKWPIEWYRVNCMSVVRLSEFLKAKSYFKRYVAISTPEVYGATGDNIKECHHYHPSTPYAASKLAGDAHLFALCKHDNFPVVFTRAANLYGIHQQLYRIIPRTIIYLKLGKTIQLHGGGKTRRAFIHARDVADLTHRAITDGENGRVYHIAPENEVRSIAEIVKFICDIMGYDFSKSVELIDENFGQDSLFSMDAARAREELGWSPQVTFENGVRETIEWIDKNWDFIQHQELNYIFKK